MYVCTPVELVMIRSVNADFAVLPVAGPMTMATMIWRSSFARAVRVAVAIAWFHHSTSSYGKVILDTNTCIEYFKHRSGVPEKIDGISRDDLCVSEVTIADLSMELYTVRAWNVI